RALRCSRQEPHLARAGSSAPSTAPHTCRRNPMKRLLTAVLIGLIATGVNAQETYPSKAITIVVPNPPGGMNQITAQPLSAVIEKLYKQPAPVINKPGGTAAVGTAYVANQKPDGYTILVTTPNLYLVIEKNRAQ